MGYAPIDQNQEHRITTDEKSNIDRAFIAHYTIAAADAVAADDDFILTSTALTGAVQNKTTFANALTIPRFLTVVSDNAATTGNIIITGLDGNGDTITSTLALNGTTPVNGTKAFYKITNIALPAGTGNVKVGINGYIFIPYKLAYNNVLQIFRNNVATSVASSGFSTSVLSQNYIVPTDALNGTQFDIYIIV